ncbi:hypothetical protein SDC9_121598 [bioreactor metagenome]|uniref:Uncharacterized protein n=1 Tax=bioreactor metagenome TaxID=1076179 RepID=A0A645CCF1_9ZZZZ
MCLVQERVQVRLSLFSIDPRAHLLVKPGLVEQYPDQLLYRDEPALNSIARKLIEKRGDSAAQRVLDFPARKERLVKRAAGMPRANHGKLLIGKAPDAGAEHGDQRHILPAVVDEREKISKDLHFDRVKIPAAGLRIGGHTAGGERLRNRLRLGSCAEEHRKITVAIASLLTRARIQIRFA